MGRLVISCDLCSWRYEETWNDGDGASEGSVQLLSHIAMEHTPPDLPGDAPAIEPWDRPTSDEVDE